MTIKNIQEKLKKKIPNVSERKIEKTKKEVKTNEIPESEKTYRRKIKKKILVETDNTDNNAN